jgi:hypothetical protein
MKRADTGRKVRRTGNVRKDLSQNQRAWIASVAMAYNEAERMVDVVLSISLGLSDKLSHEVIGRINGVDGRVALAKMALADMNCPQSIQKLAAITLEDAGFSLLKRFRDRIIHASVIDSAAAIARAPSNRGQFEEILLTVKGLKAIYRRLAYVRQEIIQLARIALELRYAKETQPLETAFELMELKSGRIERLARTESKIRECHVRLRRHQKARLSLPTLPEFPSELELNAADERALQARQVDMLTRRGRTSLLPSPAGPNQSPTAAAPQGFLNLVRQLHRSENKTEK